MQAVATATLTAGGQPSTDCPASVDLADPAAGSSTPGCRGTPAEDQNSNVVVVGGEMETNHNHVQDCGTIALYDDSVSPPSTLTLRLIMHGKVCLAYRLHFYYGAHSMGP